MLDSDFILVDTVHWVGPNRMEMEQLQQELMLLLYTS